MIPAFLQRDDAEALSLCYLVQRLLLLNYRGRSSIDPSTQVHGRSSASFQECVCSPCGQQYLRFVRTTRLLRKPNASPACVRLLAPFLASACCCGSLVVVLLLASLCAVRPKVGRDTTPCLLTCLLAPSPPLCLPAHLLAHLLHLLAAHPSKLHLVNI